MDAENKNEKKQVITYSKSTIVPLSRLCRNKCGYCDYRSENSSLTVPYKTIKMCKESRQLDCREALFTAGERPDRFSTVRSTLDIWGFASYIDYVCTVCELSFLEGLMPTVDIGYITYDEIKKIRRIIASMRMMLESIDKSLLKKVSHKESAGKSPELRIEVLKNAGQLKVPVTTGILVGIGESKNARKETLEVIRDIHSEYKHIQNVVIQDFVPSEGMAMKDVKPPDRSEMLNIIAMAREILPKDIVITVHPKAKQDIIDFIHAGVTDLGSLSQVYWPQIDGIRNDLAEHGYDLHKRLPIFERYILDKWYSRKLGQVMDRYRVMLKQDIEKREAKAVEPKNVAVEK
ncbi:MAG: 7,8-didemethyl-8-hydroxy-5-deazariboflavin synthase subunit CofG [Candidatus Margulisiibacteriota bacterium]